MRPPDMRPGDTNLGCGASPVVAGSAPGEHPCSHGTHGSRPGNNPTGGFVVPGRSPPLFTRWHHAIWVRAGGRRPVSKTGVCGFESHRPCECPFMPFGGLNGARFFDNSTVEDTLFPEAAFPFREIRRARMAGPPTDHLGRAAEPVGRPFRAAATGTSSG